jgi:lipopolysaccharide/colanic/teichoic acid biosynthesis glycosyltransferase
MTRPLQLAVKRLVDVLGAFFGLLLASPLFAAIALAVYFEGGRPIFFRQERIGLRGRAFRPSKFRTMREQRDASGHLLPDDQRLTRVGRFLRRTSLDELPQLWNVLMGEMSLVGPRPLLAKYGPLYDDRQRRRHEMKPGITGLVQVEGRNTLSWEEKFDMDLRYVDGWSLWLDLKILARTPARVLRGEGISQPGHATAEEFRRVPR